MQHIDFEELVLYRGNTLSRERHREISAHLGVCVPCHDCLDQLEANDVFLASAEPLRKGYVAAFPEAIDRMVVPKLEKRMSSLAAGQAQSKFTPNRKPSNPEAPAIPDYILLNKLGTGSFGDVWRAEDLTHHPVAVKVLRKNDKDQSGEYELAGIKQARGLKHPNLVQIHHVGETVEHWYYVMDLVATTLEQRLSQEKRLSAEESRNIVAGLLDVLGSCHQSGMAHRDIKPANIGFDTDNTLKLLDLGLVTGAARSNRTRIGTLNYMAPTPAKTPDVDDLYAAGVILYCMLTGEQPAADIPAKPAADIAKRGLWSRLYQAARTATAPLPQNRFRSAADFLDTINSKTRVRKASGKRIDERTAVAETNNIKKLKDVKFMKPMQNLMSEAANVVEQLGLVDRTQNLRAELERLARQNFKVAVIGQFKVGKSTLINRVFLKQDVLFTDLEAATAVPTEIEQGKPARLEVYPYKLNSRTITLDGRSVTVDECAGEDRPQIIEQPTPEEIRAKTAGLDRNLRTEIARRTARVRLQWPAPALGAYTVIDTPGINEVNEAVVATTYRVIPEADATIFVTPARALDLVDQRFLRSQVFDKGVSRCLVAVNHDPASTLLSDSQLKDVVETIRAQLQAMGRNLPLTTICLRQSSGAGVTAQGVSSLKEFEKTLRRFMDENVLPGRLERAQAILKRELQQSMAECEVELAALQKSDTEKKAVRDRLQKEADAFADRYRELGYQFLDDLRQLQKIHFEAVARGLEGIGRDFATSFDTCPSLQAVHARLTDAQQLLTPQVEELCYRVSRETRERARDLEQKYQTSLRQAMDPWLSTAVGELKLDAGFLGEISPIVVTIADYILAYILLPGGWIIYSVLRLIAGWIPVLNRIMPQNIVKAVLIHNVQRSIRDQMSEVKMSIHNQLDASFEGAQALLQQNWENNSADQLRVITEPLERSLAEVKDPARAAKLQKGMIEIRRILDQAA